jgi:hypothetical protein
MDPILNAIIRDFYEKNIKQREQAMQNANMTNVEFTNKIIMSKEDDIRYYLRLIWLRLNNEFNLDT